MNWRIGQVLMRKRLADLLIKSVNVREDEVRALLLSFAYFFCLLCGYYILRPLREEMGVAGGVRNLPWLFTGTFLVMLAAIPAFGSAVARFPRRNLVPFIYRFFIVNILLFYLLFSLGAGRVYLARAFFIWVSVYNLFVVSVFWSFMADIFESTQGKRLFGFIAAGGTVGALLGPAITTFLAVPLGPINLLPISALFLELAVQCIRRLLQSPGVKNSAAAPVENAIGGGVFAGAIGVFRSPYLLGICVYILLFTTTSTFVYFQQAHIVSAAFDSPAERTRVFALINLIVGLLTLGVQWFVTGRFMARFGVGRSAAFLPLVVAAGFLALAVSPVLAVLIAFQSIRRASNFAISKPAREVLFTVVGREEKYKSKNFIDTVVYRGGDAVS
ncbi:MAG: MFS transporter, partial [Nitrospinaceae bacterium]|nr:MFS transporter [Nitrospinaceae bacterium]